ncbi:hypothetical protein [Luteolibacter soli]|uniref:Uncharacterized protein n=1 Tax=Luteolibacter soli TaxID=3135280 RepID=A0ABU9B0C0_9BACT
MATMLLGLPSVLMWLGGLFATMASMVYLIAMPSAGRLISLKWLWASLMTNLIGYTMVATVSWLNGSHHYRMPGHRLPAYVAMEILDQLLAAVSVGFFVLSMISLFTGEPAFPLLWILFSVSGFVLLGFSMRLRTKLANGWRDELLAGPEGAKPLY